MMHHIQRAILGQLMQGESLRYSEIKPKGIESNLFAYHLKALKDEGLVLRTGWGAYGLTPAGKRYVDTLSLGDLKPRVQPKIVILLACHDRLGRWLLMRRKVQPLLGKIGFPYGKLHRGETIAEAAHREMLEKIGIDVELHHRGDGYITIQQHGEPISEVLFHLFSAVVSSGEPQVQHPAGEVFWSQPEEDWSRTDMMASMPDLLEAMSISEDRFFLESFYDID